MSKVFIEESSLTAIGDAVRAKTGSSDLLVVPDGMVSAISSIETGGGGDSGIPEEAFTITGDCSYRFINNGWNWFVENYGNRVTTKDITNMLNIFNSSNKLTKIPFAINLKENTQDIEARYAFANCNNIDKVTINVPTTSSLDSMANMFASCNKLTTISNINCNHTSYKDMSYLFYYCNSLEQLPYLYNAYPSNITFIFGTCQKLRSIPEDYFDTWNFDRINTDTYAGSGHVFADCRSIRQIPIKILSYLGNSTVSKASYNCLYNALFNNCYALDEIIGMPVDVNTELTSNIFGSTIASCYRIKNLTFATNEDGSPKVTHWRNQTLDFASNFTGYASNASKITGFNSGITADKEVKDDATYQALKNDADWFTTKLAYSRYNHDSAVATINSLPDTSAYLATAGGTNTIKFKGESGSATNGGAINTLTEEEIAVATAKGWTVTFS